MELMKDTMDLIWNEGCVQEISYGKDKGHSQMI